MENIKTFHYELQDFLDANKIVHNVNIQPMRLLKIFTIYIFALLSVPIGMFLFSNLLSFLILGHTDNLTFNGLVKYFLEIKNVLLILQVFIAPAVVLIFLSELIGRFRLWLYIRKNPHVVQEKRTLTFSEQGINHSISTANSNIQWDYFKYAIEGRKYFILSKTKNDYMIIPKRIFSEVAEEEEFRNLIKNKLGALQERVWNQ